MAVFVLAAAMFLKLYKNPWPLIFAPVVLIFICTYSYSKRFTSLSHFWLGCFAWSCADRKLGCGQSAGGKHNRMAGDIAWDCGYVLDGGI